MKNTEHSLFRIFSFRASPSYDSKPFYTVSFRMTRKNKLRYQVLKQDDEELSQKGKKQQRLGGGASTRRRAASRRKVEGNDESFRQMIEGAHTDDSFETHHHWCSDSCFQMTERSRYQKWQQMGTAYFDRCRIKFIGTTAIIMKRSGLIFVIF